MDPESIRLKDSFDEIRIHARRLERKKTFKSGGDEFHVDQS